MTSALYAAGHQGYLAPLAEYVPKDLPFVQEFINPVEQVEEKPFLDLAPVQSRIITPNSNCYDQAGKNFSPLSSECK